MAMVRQLRSRTLLSKSPVRWQAHSRKLALDGGAIIGRQPTVRQEIFKTRASGRDDRAEFVTRRWPVRAASQAASTRKLHRRPGTQLMIGSGRSSFGTAPPDEQMGDAREEAVRGLLGMQGSHPALSFLPGDRPARPRRIRPDLRWPGVDPGGVLLEGGDRSSPDTPQAGCFEETWQTAR